MGVNPCSQTLKSKIFPEEWRLLHQHINDQGFGIQCSAITYECYFCLTLGNFVYFSFLNPNSNNLLLPLKLTVNTLEPNVKTHMLLMWLKTSLRFFRWSDFPWIWRVYKPWGVLQSGHVTVRCQCSFHLSYTLFLYLTPPLFSYVIYELEDIMDKSDNMSLLCVPKPVNL